MTLLYELHNPQAGYRQVLRAPFPELKPGAVDVLPQVAQGSDKEGPCWWGLSTMIYTEP